MLLWEGGGSKCSFFKKNVVSFLAFNTLPFFKSRMNLAIDVPFKEEYRLLLWFSIVNIEVENKFGFITLATFKSVWFRKLTDSMVIEDNTPSTI